MTLYYEYVFERKKEYRDQFNLNYLKTNGVTRIYRVIGQRSNDFLKGYLR